MVVVSSVSRDDSEPNIEPEPLHRFREPSQLAFLEVNFCSSGVGENTSDLCSIAFKRNANVSRRCSILPTMLSYTSSMLRTLVGILSSSH